MTDPLANPSRRAFLLGADPMLPTPQRPPWSLAEILFVAACDGCGACIADCPEGILAADPRAMPVVDFSRGAGACTFCGICADVCKAGAFQQAETRASPWTWRATIADACLAAHGIMCQSCKDACSDSAIHFAYRAGRVAQPVIDPARCTGCGACQAPCPAAAISFRREERADA